MPPHPPSRYADHDPHGRDHGGRPAGRGRPQRDCGPALALWLLQVTTPPHCPCRVAPSLAVRAPVPLAPLLATRPPPPTHPPHCAAAQAHRRGGSGAVHAVLVLVPAVVLRIAGAAAHGARGRGRHPARAQGLLRARALPLPLPSCPRPACHTPPACLPAHALRAACSEGSTHTPSGCPPPLHAGRQRVPALALCLSPARQGGGQEAARQGERVCCCVTRGCAPATATLPGQSIAGLADWGTHSFPRPLCCRSCPPPCFLPPRAPRRARRARRRRLQRRSRGLPRRLPARTTWRLMRLSLTRPPPQVRHEWVWQVVREPTGEAARWAAWCVSQRSCVLCTLLSCRRRRRRCRRHRRRCRCC